MYRNGKPNKLLSGSAFKQKINMLRKAKAMAKAIPGVGAFLGLASSLKSGDIMAATPVGGASEVGQDKAIEDPSSPEYKARMEKLKKQHMMKKLKKKN